MGKSKSKKRPPNKVSKRRNKMQYFKRIAAEIKDTRNQEEGNKSDNAHGAPNIEQQEETKCLILRLLGDKSKETELSVCNEDDANLLQDLDLAVLGSAAEDYKTYTELLRKEYATVPDESYKQMRLRHYNNNNIEKTDDISKAKKSQPHSEEQPTSSTAAKPNNAEVQTPSHGAAVLAPADLHKLSPRRFRKFVDSRLRQTKRGRLQKIAANNLRQKFKQNRSPRNYAEELREKLNANEQTKTSRQLNKTKGKRRLKLNESQAAANTSQSTIEDGEIVSADEQSSTPTVADDEDDCIIIEQPIEEITIADDELPSGSFIAPGFKSFVEQQLQKQTNCSSTPTLKRSQRTAAKPKDGKCEAIEIDSDNLSDAETDNGAVLEFFVDTKPSMRQAKNGFNQDVASKNKEHVKSAPTRAAKRSFPFVPTLADEKIITLDDTEDITIQPSKRSKSLNDSSVIFVSETNADNTPTYIPLESADVPNPINVPATEPLWQRRPAPNLFTTAERKKLAAYNENTYNPNPGAETVKNRKRFVVIDGSNVAYSHGRSKCFSVKGLSICIEYFEKMGHQVKCVVPLYRQNRYKSTEPEELERLYKEGKVIYTPCKNLPGNSASSYDDRFILQIASQLDAAIISNDNYRDLLQENEAFKKLIENRVVGYTWCDDMFMLPKDPYGRNGPTLHAILNCR